MKTKIITLLISLFIAVTAFAQAPNWDWARQSGSQALNYTNSAYGSATDAAGNVYVCGSYQLSPFTLGGVSLTNSGGLDVFVAKYDPLGVLLWAKKAGGSLDEEATSITVDNSGNVIIAGYFKSATITFGSAPFLTNSSAGYADIFVVKYNSSGTVLWAKRAGGTGDDKATGIASDANDNTFVNGTFTVSFTYGTNNLSNYGGVDLFTAKHDASGNVAWAASGGGTGDETPIDICTDPSGNVYIGGYYASSSVVFGGSTLTLIDTKDIYLVKYDNAGSIVWTKREGATGINQLLEMCSDNVGNIICIGSFANSTITIGGNIISGPGYFMVKYDGAGSVIWIYSMPGYGSYYGIAADNYGNFFLTGTNSYSITFGSVIIASGFNPFVVYFNSAGTAIWGRSTTHTGGLYQNTESVSVDDNADAYITGRSNCTTMVFDTTTLASAGGYDIFVAKLGSITVGLDELNTADNLNIYPNPANDNIIIAIAKEAEIEISNIEGQLIKSINATENNTTIDISAFAKGMYFVKVKTENGIAVKKFIKE